MKRLLAVPVLVALALAGCKNDFSPQSDLLALRVLALVADNPELAPNQPVTIVPKGYVPPGSTVTVQRWTFCPISAGAVSGYACAVPQCEVELAPGQAGAVTATPTALIASCLGWTGGTVPPGIPDQILTVFRYRLATDHGESADAVLQIPLWTRAAPPNPNRNPVILGVDIGDVPAVEGTPTPPLPVGGTLPVRLRIDPASVQSYVDAAGVTQTETMTGYFYTTAGTFSAGITTGVTTTSNLEGTGLLAGQTTALVWVVALDLRGGQAIRGPFTVPIGQ